MLLCYNRGCGQKFDPNNNNDDSCRHHPGEPYFHDAYKEWTCCKKKSVDFTEFLNMKGCTLSKHSSEKPVEAEKPPKILEEYDDEPVKTRFPIIKQAMIRPSFDSPLTEITPSVLPALKTAVDSLVPNAFKENEKITENVITIGTNCKNGGCYFKYTSPESEESQCQYHPGAPIFHEGLKYWSCCNKKTSDFTAFMNQVGCTYGDHKWITDNDKTVVNCRYDWHQTPSDVIVAFYAKLYHYAKSKVRVNPVRLNVKLIFPDQKDAEFNLDLELQGIIKVESTTVKMYTTKVEITMPKAEAGTWIRLDVSRDNLTTKTAKLLENLPKEVKDYDSGSDIDLDDIETVTGAKLTNIS